MLLTQRTFGEWPAAKVDLKPTTRPPDRRAEASEESRRTPTDPSRRMPIAISTT
ncbi:protein of unknown function [Blastococcus saxobsidens DD2]|uniref:Uncharacterized protein n=1 Tax=Blastococcus saxobsidens (strain DD2) TaxID=1146883 RepID=H6RP46_BLASD|nr:protein of unknown function [Blastococcus saxobsidens DD2]